MALWCPYLRLWFHLEICPVEQLAARAKSLFVLPGADRWDSQWEWSYVLADSACVPGMGSEEVVGEEQFLAQWTAQIRRRWAHQQGSQGRCSPVPAPSKQPLQSLPQVSEDVTQTASCSPKPTPTLSAGTCKWVTAAVTAASAAVTGKVSPAWYRVCSILSVCSCPLCFAKWREEDFNFFFTKQWNQPFLGKILPAYLLPAAAWCSTAAIYLPLGSIFAVWALSMAADETYTWHGKLYSIFPALLWVIQPCTPSNAHTGVQKAGEGRASCCSSGPVYWCNPVCCDSLLLG